MKPYRLAVLALVALATSSSLHAQEPQLDDTPHMFSGYSEGNGSLRLFLGRPRSFHVESYGYELGGGTSRLDQTVFMQGKRPQYRSWMIQTVGPNRYTGTLTDATGGVTGHTEGNRLFLRYRVAGPFVMHQTLGLRPDGRTIDNRGRITLLGIPVGRLQETITRK